MFSLSRRLPWQIALGALVLYAATSGHGVTVNSLSLTAKLTGWDWLPMVGQPLFWLFTLPLRLLPSTWVPFSLNFFFAAIAAVTLGLLARTVQLILGNPALEKVNHWIQTLPVLLACSMCGLEFNFWQEATATTGEMLAFLPLATAVWLMLEYRVHHNIRWLDWAAFVWGLGMTENWLMQLALPVFGAGAAWLKVTSQTTRTNQMEVPLYVTAEFWLERFYALRFDLLKLLGRLAGFGFAGFLIYALLPLANSLASDLPTSQGQTWLASLKQTKHTITQLHYQFWVVDRMLLLTTLLYFLVPILSCLIPRYGWTPVNEPKTNPLSFQPGKQPGKEIFIGIIHRNAATGLENWFFRGLCAVLFLASLWLAFDPTTGLRQIIFHQLSVSMPLLTFDYFNALGAAYLIGSFLLATQNEPPPVDTGIPWRKLLAKIPWRQLAIPITAAYLVLVTGGLAERNAPAIFSPNIHPLQRFGELAIASLPAGRGAMLSDQPQKLAAFQAALSQSPMAPDWLAVDTRLLPLVAYRASLQHRQPSGWLTDENQHDLSMSEIMQLLEQIAQTNRLFFLNPSSGALFEQFYQEPVGSVYELKWRNINSLELPPLPPATIAANETFWTTAWQKELSPLASTPAPPPAHWWQKKIQQLGYIPAARLQDRWLTDWYSVALDCWGVALQRQGRWPEAQRRFEQALQLNTNNYSAQISLACNTNFRSGIKQGLADLNKVVNQLGNYRRLSLVMNSSGPFDEPVFCYLLGEWYQQTGLLRQAAEQFERTRILAPGVTAPEFALAKLYAQFKLNDRVHQLVSHIHEETKNIPTDRAQDLEMALMEADSWLSQTNAANASSALQFVVQQHPDDEQIANRVISAYLAFGDYANADRLIRSQLAKTPDDVHALNSQAAILLKSGAAAAAIPVLDHVLTLTNLVAARLNRANAQILCRNFAAAETDYLELEKTGAESGRVSYGLATIAEHRHDTNQAVRYYQASLNSLPPGTHLWRQASVRLQALEAHSETK